MKINQAKIRRLRRIFQLNRIRILREISNQEKCACELVDVLKIPNNLLSHHLKVLSDMGLIVGRKKGLHVKYSLEKKKGNEVRNIIKCLEKMNNS